jgi:TPR repeat protein
MYEKGYGVKIDYEMAAKFYEKAAILGHANSYNYLGFHGRGVEKDYDKAFELVPERSVA